MNKLIISIALLMTSMFLSNAIASNDALIQKCDMRWNEITSSETQYNKILQKWLNIKRMCKNTGLYEYRLASLYDSLGDVEKTNQTIEYGLKLNTGYSYYLNSIKLFAHFRYLVSINETSMVKFNKILQGYKALMKQKPGIETAYEQAANIELAINKVADAKKHALQALNIHSKSWISMRVLVITYQLNNEFDKAKPLITKAIKLNESLMSDHDFMISAAWTYAKLNDIKTSEAVILNLYERVPSVNKSKEFIEVLNYVKKNLT